MPHGKARHPVYQAIVALHQIPVARGREGSRKIHDQGDWLMYKKLCRRFLLTAAIWAATILMRIFSFPVLPFAHGERSGSEN